jgi:dihydroxy-acid dehydratase
LHGDCLVTGKTLAENLAIVPDLNDGQEVIHEIQKALKATGNIQILFGNLAEVVLPKLVEMKESILKEMLLFMKKYDVITGVRSGEVKPGNVVVIRYCGPKGGPGMPEMLSLLRRWDLVKV